MFQNFPRPDQRALGRFAASVAGPLASVGLALAAPFIGLAFIVLLPLIGPVLIGALAIGAACDAARVARRHPAPAAKRCVGQFAH